MIQSHDLFLVSWFVSRKNSGSYDSSNRDARPGLLIVLWFGVGLYMLTQALPKSELFFTALHRTLEFDPLVHSFNVRQEIGFFGVLAVALGAGISGLVHQDMFIQCRL